MRKRVLIEDSGFGVKVSRGSLNLLTEARKTEKEGAFLIVRDVPSSVLGEKNQNDRIYPKRTFQEIVKKYEKDGVFESRTLLCSADGHPDDNYVQPVDASHVVIGASVRKVEGRDILFNDWLILDTESGRSLRNLIEAKVSFGTSIRGFGNLTESGEVTDYEYLGTDAVSNPSAGTFSEMFEATIETEDSNSKEGILRESTRRRGRRSRRGLSLRERQRLMRNARRRRLEEDEDEDESRSPRRRRFIERMRRRRRMREMRRRRELAEARRRRIRHRFHEDDDDDDDRSRSRRPRRRRFDEEDDRPSRRRRLSSRRTSHLRRMMEMRRRRFREDDDDDDDDDPRPTRMRERARRRSRRRRNLMESFRNSGRRSARGRRRGYGPSSRRSVQEKVERSSSSKEGRRSSVSENEDGGVVSSLKQKLSAVTDAADILEKRYAAATTLIEHLRNEVRNSKSDKWVEVSSTIANVVNKSKASDSIESPGITH